MQVSVWTWWFNEWLLGTLGQLDDGIVYGCCSILKLFPIFSQVGISDESNAGFLQMMVWVLWLLIWKTVLVRDRGRPTLPGSKWLSLPRIKNRRESALVPLFFKFNVNRALVSSWLDEALGIPRARLAILTWKVDHFVPADVRNGFKGVFDWGSSFILHLDSL